ncbi:unnamed protein product [Arctia plantaginis]|uniref:GPI ethanolamine phosphate transferase 1 n=1 Tax=Arctia plantaginis TaxID=874455 RepID=A0A8S1A6Q6_ARCPL|nr:unnamed protein product [Arctia plantaginis]
MPYLREVANTHGRWGISNTQVPTESRPGHVAVIAGFYEDPSAVAKGWKENPVDFDSVFNQTSFTWCWGTYDIVNIFTKADVTDHIVVHDFDPYDDNFSTNKNTTLLDEWVFKNVKTFFQNLKDDSVLSKKLKHNKIIFFLHLLGTDTAGHTHKPKTKNFLTTLSYVDKGIKEIEKVIRDYYHDDGKTTFLMTSDHGMTDWGSHGAGDDHETQTPYVIWGSGVKQKKYVKQDFETNGMSLEHRFDINQVDLAPLMSTILSIPVPVNSKGKLSTEILNMSLANKSKAMYSNARQLASQYNKKRLQVEENALPLLYKPYESLSKEKYQEFIEFTEKLLTDGQYEKCILLSEEIIHLSLSGLQYYHNYYQLPLLLLVTASFIGWIGCLLKILTEQQYYSQAVPSNLNSVTCSSKSMSKWMNSVFIFLCGLSFFLVYAQNLPTPYYLYFLLPIFLWWYVLVSSSTWLKAFGQFRKNKQILSLLLQILSYALGSMALALSFTYRWMLSVPLLGMGMWPIFSLTKHHLSNQVLVSWQVGCILLSIFTFIPVVGKNVFIELVLIADKKEIVLTAVQVVLLILSLQNIYVQSKRFETGSPVSYYYQTLSWTISAISLVIPLMFSKRIMCRLLAVNTSIINFYLLLSVSHEGLFIVALIFNLICWIFIEFKLLQLKDIKLVESSFDSHHEDELKSFASLERGINCQDFRRAFFFVVYIIVAFFGTGNIASLNSFEVRWVTCFITSFQPFIITALVLLKTLAPFLSVACSFRAVQHLTKAPIGYLNMIVLIYSNLMGIQLLYNVKNTGSWLEIGTSISQFVIVQVITLFIVIINFIAKLLTDISIHSFTGKIFRSRKKNV